MAFPEAIAAEARKEVVRLGTLVEFDFLSGPKRVWNGARKLLTQDGREWEALFGLGSIEGLQQSVNGSAPEQRFSVSGVDERFAATARGEAHEYINRAVRVYWQFFTEDWETLDQPLAVGWARMRSLNSSRTSTDDGYIRVVKISAETPFGETKRRPRFGYCTDRDQKRRFPFDRAMERVAGIEVKSVNFPDVGGD